MRTHSADLSEWLPLVSASLGGIVLGLSVWLVLVMRAGPEPDTSQTVAQTSDSTSDSGINSGAWPTGQGAVTVVNKPIVGETHKAAPTAVGTKDNKQAVTAPSHGAVASGPANEHRTTPAATTPARPAQASPATAIAQAGPAAHSAAAKPGEGSRLTKIEGPTHGIVINAPLVEQSTGAKAVAPVSVAPPARKDTAALTGPVLRIDIDARLADRLPTIDFRDTPLDKFIGFMSGLSTIPIELDKEGLTRAGATSSVPVSVRLSNATVAKALRTALEPHHLAFRKLDGRLVITAAIERPRP